MADQSAVFAIETEAKGQGEMESLADALERLQADLKADKAALNEMNAAMKSLQGAGSVNINAFKQLKEQIAAQKAKIGETEAAYINLGGTFKKVGKAAGDAADGSKEGAKSLDGILASAKGAAGPMGGLFEKVNMFKGAIEKIGASKAIAVGAFAAIAVAAIALIGALVSATIEITKFALASAEAARNSKMSLEGILKSTAGAEHLGGTIRKLASELPQSTAELQAMAEQLAKTGLKGAELDAALRKMATDQAVAKFGSVKGGMLSLSVQLAKFKDNLADIFAGVNIEPFLKGLREVLQLFDSSTSSGKALRAIAEGLLNPLFSMLGRLMPLAKGFFQGMIIGALVLTIVILKVKNAFMSVFGEALGKVDLLTVGVYLGVAAFAILTAIVVIFGVALLLAFLPAIVAVALLLVGVLLLLAPFILVAAAIYYVVTAVSDAWDAISGFDFGELGSNIVSSIADAISAGASWVWDAMKGMASGAIGAFKSALGISSPSKVFKGAGKTLPQGTAQGIKEDSHLVDNALSGMVEAPDAIGAADAGAPGGGGGGKPAQAGKSITIGEIHITGVKDADEMNTKSFITRVAQAIEGTVTNLGAPLDPEPAT